MIFRFYYAVSGDGRLDVVIVMRHLDKGIVKKQREPAVQRGEAVSQKIAKASIAFCLIKQMLPSTVSNMCNMSVGS